MSETTFEVTVSSDLVEYGFDKEQMQREFTEWLVLRLFRESRISSGKAARLLGIERIDFIRLLHKRGIPYIDLSPEELAEELATARALTAGGKA